jgi:predicted dehydrogenase
MDDALLCIEHGKAVVCEKPFTMNADEARRVIGAARDHKVFCMEAMWMRFVPSIRRVATLVADGAIGQARTVQADFSVANSYDERSRLFDPQQGGGALLDLGVYAISLAVMLLGPPVRVVSHAVLTPSGVDEQAGIIIGHAGGAMSVLTCSLRTFGSNQAVVSGTRGSIRIEGPICAPRRIDVTNWTEADPGGSDEGPGRLEAFIRSRPSLVRPARLARDVAARLMRRGPRTLRFDFDRNGYEYEAAEVMRCLRAGELESPIMQLDETLRVMALMDVVRARWGLSE